MGTSLRWLFKGLLKDLCLFISKIRYFYVQLALCIVSLFSLAPLYINFGCLVSESSTTML